MPWLIAGIVIVLAIWAFAYGPMLSLRFWGEI